MDLVGLFEELSPDRILNLFESIILEEQVRNASAPEDERNKFKAHLRTLRRGGTISRTEFEVPDREVNSGWTNDDYTRQPPKYVEPTENGYPGLEPPVG